MRVYLDHNASTPLDEEVRVAMCECLSLSTGNPSSTHRFGRAARARIDQAREAVAALAGAQPGQVIFTSGGTEANNLALLGVTGSLEPGKVAVSAIEHPSVLEPAHALAGHGWSLELICCDADGRVTPGHLDRALKPGTRLVSVMAANNETGVIQDVEELAYASRSAGAVFHSDAVQAAGKLPLDFESSGVQLMTLSAHKINGPTGVGALIYDRSLDLTPMIGGGGQESALRSGTENVAGIVGFGVAAQLAAERREAYVTRTRKLRDRLEAGLQVFPQVTVFADGAERLSNTVQMRIAGIDGEALLMQLDRQGVAVSSGSACASGSGKPSHVLTAMGIADLDARGAVRISLGHGSSEEDVDYLLKIIAQQIDLLHKAGRVAGW